MEKPTPNPFNLSPGELSAAKREFARALLKHPSDGGTAAFRVFNDPSNALLAAQTWSTDPEVLNLMDDLREELGPDAYLTTKDETAREILDMAQNPKLDPKHRLAAFSLYAQVQGMISKDALKVDMTGPVKELMATIGDQGRPKPKGAS